MANAFTKSRAWPALSHEEELAIPSKYVKSLMGVLGSLPISAINEVVDRLLLVYHQNRTMYVFGNGGSASLASHIACDLGKGSICAGKKPFRVISLTDNVALMTAWANDTSYENIFAGQVSSLIQSGDIAFAISGSGNSPNVLNGLRAARSAGAFTIGLTGFGGGKMKSLCDVCIVVPANNMQQIEDTHVCVMHAVFLAFREHVANTASGEIPRVLA